MEISVQFLVLVPVVLGVVQVIKKTGLSTRWSPLLSLVLGVVGALAIAKGYSADAVIQGLIAGLSAAGLWSGTKATLG